MGIENVYDYPHYTFAADKTTIDAIKKDDKFSNGGKKNGNVKFYAKSDEGME